MSKLLKKKEMRREESLETSHDSSEPIKKGEKSRGICFSSVKIKSKKAKK